MEDVEQKVEKKKIEKYDRQLRLWGAHGQEALEESKILLINATPTGTEALKNLVLPGIGAFTILDSHKVEAADLGNNFFVSFDSLGKSRAQVTKDLLQELNEWSKGSHDEQDPLKLIDENLSYFKQFTVVIATALPEASVRKLAKYLYEQEIPLFVARSYGFLGSIRLAVPEHTMIESKPEEIVDDLRLYNPFPALQQHADQVDLSKLNSHLHSHVPYPVLLLQQLKKWRAEHGGKSPESKEEKEAFKAQIRSGAADDLETNFEEAVNAAFKAWTPYEIPSSVQEILEDPKTDNVNANSTDFWILAAALKKFVAEEKALPLMGSIPDFTADTNSYMNLQEVYTQKARQDTEKIATNVAEILAKVGRSHKISEDQIKLFAKNTPYLKIIRIRSIEDEYASPKAEDIDNALEDPSDNTAWYLLLRGVDRFQAKYNRFPGWEDTQVLSDIPLLKEAVIALQTELGLKNSVTDDQIHEICRFGGSEMHNIGALIGGIVAQEVIKVATHQWVPMSHTLFYNGMNSTTLVFSP